MILFQNVKILNSFMDRFGKKYPSLSINMFKIRIKY